VIWEFKIENPIVELHLLLDRNFVISTSMMFTLGFIMYSTLVMLPIFLQTVLGFTAEQSGLVILPGGLVTMVMLPFVGRILGKVQPKWLIMTGFTILAIGILQLTHLKFGVGMRTPAGYWMISRLGTSCLWVPTNVMAFYYVSRTKTNQATGLINLARNIGASMGISFMTTFLYSRAQHHLDRLSGYATGVDLRHLAAVQGHAQDFVYQGLQRQAMLLSFDDSFRVTAIIAIAVIPLLFLAKEKPHADSKTIAG
jgi:MFS transporter, DHA2 family, multidrug resistance protein